MQLSSEDYNLTVQFFHNIFTWNFSITDLSGSSQCHCHIIINP